MSKLTSFLLEGNALPVTYMETQTVKEGVECDIYTFANDNTKDLAIVRVTKGYRTPLQRILLGAKTIEGYVEGIGTLTVSSADGQVMTCAFGPSENNESITVEVGQFMQWSAESDLTFYEVCEPPYEDARFENLAEEATA